MGTAGRGHIALGMERTVDFTPMGSNQRVLSIVVTSSDLCGLGTRITDPQQVSSKELQTLKKLKYLESNLF